jgi:hypothetical protein
MVVMKPSRFANRRTKNLNVSGLLMKQLIRHIAAALGGGLAGYLTTESGVPVDGNALTALIVAVYAVLEKSLKKVTGEG